MIKSMWGKCNAHEITFTPVEGGAWAAEVPASPDGVLIVEIWAEDYAGNQAYLATVKYAFDPTKLAFSVELLDIGSMCSMQEVCAMLGITMMSEAMMEEMSAALVPDMVESEVGYVLL